MNKLLIGLTQQEYELDKDILDFIDFVEIKKINDNNLAELDKHNKLISFHLQRFYDANPQPSRKIYLKYWTSPKAQKIYQKYLKRTLWYSSHITSSTEKWQSFDQGHHSVAITKPFTKDFLLKRMITNILGLKKFLTKPFLLESMDYNSYEASNGYYEHICDPDFINKVITKTGCNYLMDLSHVRTSAKNLGYELANYLQKLPLNKVVEIHLSRPLIKKKIAFDRHLPITDKELEILQKLRPKLLQLKAIKLEVFADKKTIINQLKLIKARL